MSPSTDGVTRPTFYQSICEADYTHVVIEVYFKQYGLEIVNTGRRSII